ncbi:hypothetical protein [Sanguibacter sp. HDW7]|uniref:hypothetical protein n=1 Tax=Sanguibacter sp. HDW7 TaxID=2714931 RepID=UPI00140CBF0C|nr:hypothetical protein [Sanguibacter sp. HDW7]QIK83919.1 hypothetical protein G7063_10025 [Sanguibacter sp. HDW7]
MQTDIPRNRHPERPHVHEHTSFVLTFLPDDAGRPTPGELATLLRQRSILGAVADGDDLGTPGAAVVIIAVDDGGRVLLDAEGRVVPGQPVEHLVPGLAHLTGRSVVVDDSLVVAPDGSESEPDEDSLAASLATTLVAWRSSAPSSALVRGIARGVGAAVEHATVDGWTLLALPPGMTVDAETFARSIAGAAERPVVTLQRAGESRAVTWHHRDGRHPVTIELAAPPATEVVVPEGAPGSSAALLAKVLGDGTLRIVPDTRRLDPGTLEALRALPLVRETLLHDAAALLGLPAGVAELVERAGDAARRSHAERTTGADAVPVAAAEIASAAEAASAAEVELAAESEPAAEVEPEAEVEPAAAVAATPGSPLRWLDLPGATVLEPDPTVGAAFARGLLDAALDEPTGEALHARIRRWLWRRPAALITLAILEVLVGAALAMWAVAGGDAFGQSWIVWVAAVLLVVDGGPDLVVGITLLRRRRRQA